MTRVRRLRPRGTASRIGFPGRPAALVRAAKRRRMDGEHLANEAMRLHPIYSCCAAIMESNEGLAALTELLSSSLEVVRHAVVYVVTTDGYGVIRVVKKKKQVASWTAFGGGDYPNGALRRLNTLRLELMDEAALNLKCRNVVSFSPLCIRGDTLLQVVLVSHEWFDQAELWCPESVRHRHTDLPHGGGMGKLPAHLDLRPL